MSARRAFSLVEILVVLVILLVLFAILAPRLMGGKGRDGKPIESPMQRGRSVECINNLSQLRQGYKLATMEEDAPKPQSLAEVGRGFPQSMFACPVGKQPYRYDPATGRIWCVQPGHERY